MRVGFAVVRNYHLIPRALGRGLFIPRPRRGAGATIAATKAAEHMRVSILARAEARALQSAYNVMTFNVEKRTLCEPSIFLSTRVHTIKRRRQKIIIRQYISHNANLPRLCRCYWFAHHITSAPSKSTARKFPNSLMCNSTGSVKRYKRRLSSFSSISSRSLRSNSSSCI